MGAVTTAGPLAIFAWTMHLFASSSESASSTCDGASFLSSWTWSASVQMDQQPLLGDLLAPLLVPLVPQQPLLAPLLVPLVHLRTPPPPSLHFLSRPALCFLQEAQDVASLWASHALVFAFPSGNPRVLLLHHEQKAAGGGSAAQIFQSQVCLHLHGHSPPSHDCSASPCSNPSLCHASISLSPSLHLAMTEASKCGLQTTRKTTPRAC